MEIMKGIVVTFLLVSLSSFSNAAPVGESDLSNEKESTIDPFELDVDLDDVYKYAKVESKIEEDFAKHDEDNDMLKDMVQELSEEAINIKTVDIEELNEDRDVKDSVEEIMRKLDLIEYLHSKYNTNIQVFEEEGDAQEEGDSEVSNEKAPEPVTKENDVEEEEEVQENGDSKLRNKEDLDPVRKENGMAKEQAEVKKEENDGEFREKEISQKEENQDYFTSKDVGEYSETINRQIECLMNVCIWNNAEKRHICKSKEEEALCLLDDEKLFFNDFGRDSFLASPDEMIFRPIL